MTLEPESTITVPQGIATVQNQQFSNDAERRVAAYAEKSATKVAHPVLYRRHLKDCARGYRSTLQTDCDCPVWLYRNEGGRVVRRSLGTRFWRVAQERMDGYRPEPTEPVDELAVARAVVAVSDAIDTGEWVYLIGSPTYVKIGRAKNVTRRLDCFRTGNGTELVVRRVFRGGVALEKQLHEFFSPHRKRGEWFKNSTTLQAFIKRSATWNTPRPSRSPLQGGSHAR